MAQKSFNKWKETNIEASFSNKYIFSKEISEGKQFYVFSKPFEFPFKISDLIYLTSAEERYCFVDAPEHIEEEIEDLQQENLLTEDCSDETINVCFDGDCEINVDYSAGYVEKNEERMYFDSEPLMYAAIFSEPEVYECQVKRLMQRVKELSLIYMDKEDFVIGKCDFGISDDLTELKEFAEGFSESEEILNSVSIVEKLDDKNFAQGVCANW